MGTEVQRISSGAAVTDTDPAAEFGRWYRRQRELRGISVYFVAARTKLPPSRIQGIEDGGDPLGQDGHSRATARAISRAIGADPDEGVALLSKRRSKRRRKGAGLWRRQLLRWGRHASIGLILALLSWAVVSFLLNPPISSNHPDLVYRTDYVKRLLWGEP